MPIPSVGDLLAFDALPESVKDICRNAYGGSPDEVQASIDEAAWAKAETLECDGSCPKAEELRATLEAIVQSAQIVL